MIEVLIWDVLVWLIGQICLLVLVKGVFYLQDVQCLQVMGVVGLVVLNYGGWVLDGVLVSFWVLLVICVVVGDDFLLMFDSGICLGSDIFKVLVLGVDVVLIGWL